MPDAGAQATRVTETHSAVVVLVGDRAYKWKKPVDLGFLDFRDLEQRAVACRRELELNRRLAPDVYLDVATVTAQDGTPVEHLLVMRRLPDDRRLASLVQQGGDADGCLREVARAVTSLHARTVTAAAADAASVDALRANWEDNLTVLRKKGAAHLDGEEVERAAALSSGYLDGRGPLFAERAELACDGHGDLLADDIFCLDDGPRIIDCLDFSEQYRLGDPLLDAAFLVMDLARLDRADLGERFLAWYGEFSGQPFPRTLAHHYVAYRAHVRAKVAVLRAEQGDEQAPAQARQLHALCCERLVAGQVPLVFVGGLPGTGKSTVASGLADAFGWALLSSDELRKERLGLDRGRSAPADAYTWEARSAVYRALLDRADTLLARGEPVVLDASWVEEDWREAAAATARAAAAPCVAIRCDAPTAVARERLERRARKGTSASDATPAVLDDLARRMGPWPLAQDLDTHGDIDGVVAASVELVRTALGMPAE